jgi:hypothetical protein
MKKLLLAATALAGIALFSGSAFAASDYECRSYAQQQADAYAPNGQGALAGGLLGAGAGALIGGIGHGNVGTGALVGGIGGAVVGGAMNQNKRQEVFNQAYSDCMNSGRGPRYAPQPVYDPGAPPPGYGDPGWMRACASKYRSFQWSGPHAGQFQGFDGYWHWCNL